MKKKFLSILTLLLATTLGVVACNVSVSKKKAELKPLSRIYSFTPMDPTKYEYYDYFNHAKNLDALFFDKEETESTEHVQMPLLWADEVNDTFGLAAYAGDYRYGNPGGQEAVTTMAAVLSSTLLGIDMQKDKGEDFVEQLDAYYLESEKTVLNNIGSKSVDTSMWYHIYPCILYLEIAMQYPEATVIQEHAKELINTWYKAYEIMNEAEDEASFNATGFDFSQMKAYQNGVWKEPDSAVGIALLMDYAYDWTGDKKYREATIACLDYIEEYFGGPLYEVLQYYAPYLNAKMNAEEEKNYDMAKSFGRVFDGASIPRGGWGVINGKWGEYDMSGLFGSVADRGGYAFAMNTFAGFNAILPAAKYDPTYANSIGDFALRVTQNSRSFFSEHSDKERQSTDVLNLEVPESIRKWMPYEGIINSYRSKTPWFGGDPTINDWAMTDFSLYSGAHVGIMASRIQETNIKGILKLDISERSFQKNVPFYLLYNPYGKKQKVIYELTGNTDKGVDLYDSIQYQYLEKNISTPVEIEIDAYSSVIVAELPAGTELSEKNGILRYDGHFISRKTQE